MQYFCAACSAFSSFSQFCCCSSLCSAFLFLFFFSIYCCNNVPTQFCRIQMIMNALKVLTLSFISVAYLHILILTNSHYIYQFSDVTLNWIMDRRGFSYLSVSTIKCIQMMIIESWIRYNRSWIKPNSSLILNYC